MREEAIIGATKYIMAAWKPADIVSKLPADVDAIYRASPHLHQPYNTDEWLQGWAMAICACLSTTPDGLAERTAYLQLHQRCPQCASADVKVAVGAIVAVDWKNYEDQNAAMCPICSWDGVVHDLKPAD